MTDLPDVLVKRPIRNKLLLEECGTDCKCPCSRIPNFLDALKGSDTTRRYNRYIRCIHHFLEKMVSFSIVTIREQIQAMHAVSFQLAGVCHNVINFSIQDAWMTMNMARKRIITYRLILQIRTN